MRVLATLLFSLAVGGCTSAIMKGYIGQTVDMVMVEQGVPTTAYDLPDGTRAFVWEKTTTTIIPGQTYGTATGFGSANSFGNTTTANVSVFSNTYSTPSYSVSDTCAYTLIAKRIADLDSPAAWAVVGFRKPPIMCE